MNEATLQNCGVGNKGARPRLAAGKKDGVIYMTSPKKEGKVEADRPITEVTKRMASKAAYLLTAFDADFESPYEAALRIYAEMSKILVDECLKNDRGITEAQGCDGER